MRFVLFPGYVESKTDGQLHWMTSAMLHQLYRVGTQPFICVLDGWILDDGPVYEPQEGDIACLPRYDGNYPCFEERP